MKLKDWAKKEGISYQTAYRWFKAGSLPVKAYQSESGTIIVQDENGSAPENTMNRLVSNNSDTMAFFLKKTVEFSKANGTIEDFAAYIIANFQLKVNPEGDAKYRYSKNKPTQNEINKHFQQFIKPKHFDKEALVNSFQENTETLKEEVKNNFELKDLADVKYTDQVGNSIKNFVEEATSSAFRPTPTSTLCTSSANKLGSVDGSYFVGTTDFSSLPTTQLSNISITSVIPAINNTWLGETQPNAATFAASASVGGSFQPTPRELQSFRSFSETNLSEEDESLNAVKKAKRGRPKKFV